MVFDPGNAPVSTQADKFDIDEALDNAPLSLLTVTIIIAIALAVVLEAVNNNLLGLAVPKLVDDWHLPREAFKYAVTFSMIGMASGAFVSGFIADKIGRRAVILLTLPICGLATILTGACQTMTALIILRFFVGFSFGGLLPVASSTAAEFAPVRYRTMAVTVPIVCIALGTILAGFLFNLALPLGSWRYAFYIGGLLPFVLCLILFFALPESPRFMAQARKKWPALRLLLHRLGHETGEAAVFADAADEAAAKTQKGGIKALFQNGLARDTIAIWIVSFFGIAGLYAVYMWLPAMLGAEGVSEAAARTAMSYWFSTGGFIGALLCAWACARFGSRKVMVIFAIGGAVSVFALLTFNVKEHLLPMSAFLGLYGLFNNGIQVPLYAIFAHLYPTYIRATGSSIASSIGKTGTIFAAYIGGIVSVTEYFVMLGLCMVVVTAALLVFRRHIPPIVKKQEACGKL